MAKKCHFSDGFVVGAIIGAVLGILFAPASGQETREKLVKMKEDNEELINDTKEKSEVVAKKTLDAIEKGFEKIGKMIDQNNTTEA